MTSGILSLLAALLLPSVMAARESARRLQCTNHLRQIGLALHGYHDLHGCLPAGWQDETTGATAYGWCTALLPLLEQPPIDKRLSLAAAQNAELSSVSVQLFLCPSDVTPPTFPVYGPYQLEPLLSLPSGNYVGVYGTSEADDDHPAPPGDGTFIDSRPVTWAELHRGLSNVLIVGERSTAQFSSSWLGFDRRDEDAECRVVGSALVHPNCATCDECEFSSRHSGVSSFLLGDGHVRSIAASIDQAVYQQLARRLE